MYFNIEINILN